MYSLLGAIEWPSQAIWAGMKMDDGSVLPHVLFISTCHTHKVLIYHIWIFLLTDISILEIILVPSYRNGDHYVGVTTCTIPLTAHYHYYWADIYIWDMVAARDVKDRRALRKFRSEIGTHSSVALLLYCSMVLWKQVFPDLGAFMLTLHLIIHLWAAAQCGVY